MTLSIIHTLTCLIKEHVRLATLDFHCNLFALFATCSFSRFAFSSKLFVYCTMFVYTCSQKYCQYKHNLKIFYYVGLMMVGLIWCTPFYSENSKFTLLCQKVRKIKGLISNQKFHYCYMFIY